jgi:hypothetical protein
MMARRSSWTANTASRSKSMRSTYAAIAGGPERRSESQPQIVGRQADKMRMQ